MNTKIISFDILYRMYKKKYPKKRYFKRTKYGTKKDKSQDKRIKKIEKLVKNELKSIVTVVATTNSTTAGVLTPLTAVATGSTLNTREGNVIRGATLMIRYQVNFDTNTAQQFWDPTIFSSAWMRVIIFKDKFSNGVAPAIFSATNVNALLEGSAATPSRNSIVNVNSLIIGTGRFKIIHDKVHRYLPALTESGPVTDFSGIQNNALARNIIFKYKCNHNLNYNGTAATQAELVKNHYYILHFIGEAGANYQCTLSHNCQFRFWDI